MLSGLICIPSSNFTIHNQKTKPEQVLQQSYNWSGENLVWYSKTFNLTHGDYVYVDLDPPPVWGEPPWDPVPEYQIPGFNGPKYLYVDYICNNTYETQFEIWYYQNIERMLLGINNITIYKNDCLIIENPSQIKEIGGTVKLAGSYKLRISGPNPPPRIPPGEPESYPTTIRVFKKITWEETDKPYGFLLPTGISMFAIGLISLIVLKRRKKHVKKRRL